MLINDIIALETAIERLDLSNAEKAPLHASLQQIKSQVTASASLSAETGPSAGIDNPYRLFVDLRHAPADENERYSDLTKVLQLSAVQLRMAAEISARIAQIRDPEELIRVVAAMLARRFGFYYVSVLLVDDTGQVLVIRAVNSDEFEPLVTQRTSIRIGAPGMVSKAAAHRQPCVASHVRTHPEYRCSSRMEHTRSEIALPLIAGDRLLGVIDLESDLEDDFDEGEIQTLQSLANQIGTALDNAHLFEAEQRQRRMADTLRDINLVISTLAQDDVLDLILEQIGRLVPYDAAALWRLDEATGQFRLAASAGYERLGLAEALAELVISEDAKTLSSELVSGDKIIIIPDVRLDPRWVAIQRFEWIRSWAGVRISVRGKAIGQLMLDHSQAGFYGPQHKPSLEALAIQISIAVENAQLFESERRQRTIANKTLLNLQRSNEELQQFAYVASHDLQEPLRMIASYVQLLARRYQGRLDSDADEFIAYAVDGTHRMQRLINDLLTYSRVNTQETQITPTPCEPILAETLANLQLAIDDNHAEISHDPLPTVMADPVQLGGIFQNLIGNAIKFHGPVSPRVHISAQRSPMYPDHWLFAVKDNGIGIAPEYAERIFVIFKRLHTANEYPGTGIGLSICKKIVERHGGRIWVESEPGHGATFYFTLLQAADD